MCTWVLLGSSKALTVATTILQMCTWVLRDSSKALTCTGTLHEECTGACKRDLEHRSPKCITTVTCRCCRTWKTHLQTTGPGKHIRTIHHNLFWMPLIEYMDSCTSEPAIVWTKNLALNHTALLAEMAGITMGADEPLHMDKRVEFIKDTLCRCPTDPASDVAYGAFLCCSYTCQCSAPTKIWLVQQDMASSSRTSSSSASGMLDAMRHRASLTRHLLLLDGAVDRCT